MARYVSFFAWGGHPKTFLLFCFFSRKLVDMKNVGCVFVSLIYFLLIIICHYLPLLSHYTYFFAPYELWTLSNKWRTSASSWIWSDSRHRPSQPLSGRSEHELGLSLKNLATLFQNWGNVCLPSGRSENEDRNMNPHIWWLTIMFQNVPLNIAICVYPIFRPIFGRLKHHRKRNPQFRAIAILQKILVRKNCSKLKHLRIYH